MIYVDTIGLPHRVSGPAYILNTPNRKVCIYYYHGVIHRAAHREGKFEPAVFTWENGVTTHEWWHLGVRVA